MPFFYERKFTEYKILSALLTLLVVVGFWWFGWDMRNPGLSIVVFFLPFVLTLLGSRYILARGVLLISAHTGSESHVPLGSAELHRENDHVLLKWWEGYTRRKTRLLLPDPFVAELERAIHEGEHGTGPAPATQAEARRALPAGVGLGQPAGAWYWQTALALAVLIGLFAVAFWWGLPLALLPFALLPWVFEYIEMRQVVILCGDALWLLEPRREPRSISLDQVRRIIPGANTHRLELAAPGSAPIVLNSYRSVELIKQLKRRLG